MKLFIIPSWYPTDLHLENGSFFKDRANILHKNGIDIIIGAPIVHSIKDFFRLSQNQTIQEKNNEGIPTYTLESINFFPKIEKLFYKQYKKNALTILNTLLKDHGHPDLVLINSSLWAGASLSKTLNKKNIPFIVTEHLKEFLIIQGLSKFQKKMINDTYSMASQILLSSSQLKSAITKNFNKHTFKLSLLPNPVDENIFTLKKNFNITPPFIIICISLFRPEKRIDLILKSFKNIVKTGINAKLKLIGDGPLKYKINKQIQSLGISDLVESLGYLKQRQIVNELHKSHLLVLPSEIETFGMVLIEAQACGIPVVATDCGGPSDIITNETGIIVKPKSIDHLTQGLKKMIHNLNNYNPNKIRENTIKKFGTKAYVDSIKNLINKLSV